MHSEFFKNEKCLNRKIKTLQMHWCLWYIFISIYYVKYQAAGERSVWGVGAIQWQGLQKYIQQVVYWCTNCKEAVIYRSKRSNSPTNPLLPPAVHKHVRQNKWSIYIKETKYYPEFQCINIAISVSLSVCLTWFPVSLHWFSLWSLLRHSKAGLR